MRPTCRLIVRAACLLTAMAAAQAADIVKPDVKPGLWEVTTSPKISGQMPIPEEQLAKMPPEQRARVEQAMKAAVGGAAKPHVYRECMTPEKIARGFDLGKTPDAGSCKRNVIKSSRNELQIHDECTRPEGKSTSDFHFNVSGGTQMNGTINVVMTNGSRTMTVDGTVSGKWLGADCGSVKDSELEK